ncbi:sensor histidine kinase [Microbacterium protaetiae]|uniref:histidine kinase n=1 Tax=Microbacterium protaetiae TaxID=2509458 RepID=A0A4P6EEJ0_9MICO|nr:histidine kinase [Microbacterium protaetiae]QAY60196.1 sensor histidine kinase [Microbacterium protaetiae]
MFRRLLTYQIVIDAVVAVLFALVALPFEIGIGQGTPANAGVSVLVCVLFGVALAARRISPPLALGLAWAGAIVQMGFGRSPGFVDLAVFAVLYTAAAYGTRLLFWAGFGSALLGAVVATAYVYIVLSAGSVSLSELPIAVAVLIAATFALLLAWTVGALARTGRRARSGRLAQRRAEAEAAIEQERTRIARDMHDVVAHSLAVVIAQADGARYAAASDPAAQTAALGTISSTARSALADVRLLLAQLRHTQEDGPQPTVADLEPLFGQMRAAGLDLRVTIDPAPRSEAPAAVQLAVYRILQEALTNALRHGANDTPVEVGLAWHPTLVEVTVRNTVRAVEAPTESRGHGMIGMRERALLVGGTLDAGAEAGRFVVRARIPVSEAT